MITEIDNLKAQNTFDLIDSSTLNPKLKSDLKESTEEAKLNLNGRTLEERCASIARNQFDMTRFICGIIIQFKNMTDELTKPRETKRTWKDVVAECKWPLVVLGSIISVCAIYQPQIIDLLKAITAIVR